MLASRIKALNDTAQCDWFLNCYISCTKELVIVSLTSMPGLLKTALFINNERYNEIFGLSIMQHILLEKSSHGHWLKYVSEFRPERVMLYYNELSKLMTDDLNGMLPQTVEIDEEDFVRHASKISKQSGRSSLRKAFMGSKSEKWNMFSTLSSSTKSHLEDNTRENRSFNSYAEVMKKKRNEVLNYLSYDLLVLSNVSRMSKENQLQAASTRVIQMIVDKQTSRPFVSCLTVLDTIFHFILYSIGQAQTIIYLTQDSDYNFGHQWYAFSVTSLIMGVSVYYFVVRELLQIASNRSWTGFKENILFDLWNHIDLLAIVLIVSLYRMLIVIFCLGIL